MNYAQLTQAIQDYVESTESSFVASIPTFVRQAEELILRNVQIPELRKNVTGNMTSGSPYLARPSDFLSVFSLAVIDGSGNYSYLYDKDVSFMREAYPNPATTGVPKYYAQFDGDSSVDSGFLLVGPTPNASYDVELHYYYDPESIVTNGTSWLGDNAETALLYGSLVQAYTYLKGDADVIQLYKTMYADAMKAIFTVEIMSKRDSYRDGELRTG